MSHVRSRSFLAAALVSVMGLATGLYADEPRARGQDAPEGRASAPQSSSVQTIAQEQLAASFDRVLLIDVRNKAEFEVLRISGSTNLPLSQFSKDQLVKAKSDQPGKQLVFVSNGGSCPRAERAAAMAAEWGIEGAAVFAAGVQSWSAAQPGKTAFFGQVLEGKTDQLISQEKFNAAIATPSRALELAAQGYKVFDIRDQVDRKQFAIELSGTSRMNINDFVSLLNRNHTSIPQSKLLIIDNEGGSVKLVQYYLERAGRKDYVFVKDGVLGWRSAGLNGAGQPAQATASVPDPQ